jgi:hypothetical protein
MCGGTWRWTTTARIRSSGESGSVSMTPLPRSARRSHRPRAASLGATLLQDGFLRLSELSDEIGCRGLLVHSESSESRDFYRHLVPEFEPSPSDDLHLFLLMKDIRRTLR